MVSVTVETVELRVPEPIYRRLAGSAAATKRSVDEILATTLAAVLPPAPDLPEALASELAEMIWLSDDNLHAAIKPSFSKKEQRRLAELNETVDIRTLTKEEKAEQTTLLASYERALLKRAQAFSILARRGHHIPTLAELPLVV